MKIVQKKVKAGDTETVIEPEEEAPREGAKVIDLTELLTRSLKGAKAGAAAKKGARAAPKAGKTAAKKTATRAKAAPARKSEERKAA